MLRNSLVKQKWEYKSYLHPTGNQLSDYINNYNYSLTVYSLRERKQQRMFYIMLYSEETLLSQPIAQSIRFYR